MENLNDIYTPETTMIPASDTITVEIVNSANGAKDTYDIFPENTLGMVVDKIRGPLGLGTAGDINVEYNGITTASLNKTVADMGIVTGSKLIIHPNAKVA